jgi:hypothetical protein
MEINQFTPDVIETLKDNEIFVFGSNENGAHRGGAARMAFERFGAEWGVAVGRSGQTYAIPTLDRDMRRVEPEMLYIHFEDFIEYVVTHPELTFYLTKVGCGIAGWNPAEVKKLLWEAVGETLPPNLIIPEIFTK